MLAVEPCWRSRRFVGEVSWNSALNVASANSVSGRGCGYVMEELRGAEVAGGGRKGKAR